MKIYIPLSVLGPTSMYIQGTKTFSWVMGVVYISIKIFGPLLFFSAQDTKIKYINVLINIQYSKTVLAKLQTFHNSIIRVNTVLTKKTYM